MRDYHEGSGPEGSRPATDPRSRLAMSHGARAWRKVIATVMTLMCLPLAGTGVAAQTESDLQTTLASPVDAQPVLNSGLGGAPTIDRDRADRQPTPIPRSAAPVRLPKAAVAIEATARDDAGAAIRLARVRIVGSSLSPQALARTVAPFSGSPLTRPTLQKLADAVTALYAKSDIAFYSVKIPAQSGAGGVLVIAITEGRIVRYKIVKQTRSTPNRLIAHQMHKLLAEKVTRKSTIERTMALLRETPGQTVSAKLLPTSKPDEVALDLDVKRKQIEFTLNLDNGGIVNVTSAVQAQAGVAINGLLREGDTTRLTAYLPIQPSRYQFYTASHATPIGSDGTMLGISGAYIRTKTKDPEVVGTAKQAALAITHPLVRTHDRNLTVSASVDATDSNNYYLDTAFGGFKTRAARLAASWSVAGQTDGYAISGTLSQGLNVLNAQTATGYSKIGFWKANAQIVGIKQIVKNVAIKVGVRGQFSADKLPTTERFSLGGDGAGVAYRLGIYTADKAAAGNIELSWQIARSEKKARALTVFAYADGAVARSYARPTYDLPAQNFSLASAGGGLRIVPAKGWIASAEVAVPVKRPSSEVSHKVRVLFNLIRTI